MLKASSQTTPQANRHSSEAGTILLVEDHQGYREVMRAALGSYLPDFHVVEAESVETALVALGKRGFEVMVTDMTLPDGTAIELLDGAGRSIAAGMKVITISGHDSREMLPVLNRDDVHGHVSKESGIKALAQAVLAVAGEGRVSRS
jgi:DNA-binding NarL/FixJ family response regulator